MRIALAYLSPEARALERLDQSTQLEQKRKADPQGPAVNDTGRRAHDPLGPLNRNPKQVTTWMLQFKKGGATRARQALHPVSLAAKAKPLTTERMNRQGDDHPFIPIMGIRCSMIAVLLRGFLKIRP